MLLLACAWRAHPREAAGRTDLVDVAHPAVVEHPFVAPFVAEFLDQRGNEAGDRVIGMDRGFWIELFDSLGHRRGVLNAGALRRYHERNDRSLGVFLE